ncbi:MAG: PAAR domain-containing protein, partial [Gammaproteobacteria bacterium]
GTITGIQAPSVYADGDNIVCIGAAIQPHGVSPHDAAVMTEGSSTVYAEGIAVCREGDLASCGDAATGSTDVFAG